METAVTCVSCGAPVSIAAARETLSECPYCKATLRFAPETAGTKAAPAPPLAGDPRLAFNKALQTRLAAGDSPTSALRAAAKEYTSDEAEAEAIARATLAIAYDFDKENQTHVMHDVTALQRIAAAFIKARTELASAADTEMNLPFLCATDSGPKNLQRRLVSSDIAELSARQPAMFDPPARQREPEPEQNAETTKKKKWWPFG